MSTNLCRPPEPICFTGNVAHHWQEFSEQLHWFLAGTESLEKSDAVKIGIMLTHAGSEAREIYKTLHWNEEGDNMKFDKVTKAFKEYCSPRKNILYERYKFWTLNQKEGEPIHTYLTRLKVQVDHCDYHKEGWPSAIKTEMIRDKFVFGLNDSNLKERLLRETDISLDKMVILAQRTESSKQQIKEMTASTMKTVEAISERKPKEFMCGRCGHTHKPKECPAYGQQCSVCHKLHHFARVCRSKQSVNAAKGNKLPSASTSRTKVFTVQKDDTSSDTDSEPQVFMHALQVHGITGSSWFSTVDTKCGEITFKLDTGAEASVLPIKAYRRLKNKPTIESTNITLSAYGGSIIKPMGTCNIECQGKARSAAVMFYVVPIVAQPILGLADCVTLGLIERVHSLATTYMSKETIKAEFGDVFKGLGNLGDYHITLKDQVTPVIRPPRRVPHSLLGKLKQCIEANLRCGVLKRVDQPTDWVHNLVIVEKKNGALRLCLDPRDLNKVIKREHYNIPTIQDVSSHLAGKKIFSTLDLKDGFWQISLDEQSSFLCTFNTPFGRFRFTRMPFGLNSATEVFQKKNEAAFTGIEGIHIVADDIIIAADTIEEHDAILQKVLTRARERNIKFNLDKLQLRVNVVKYLGTIIGADGVKPDPAKILAISNMPTPVDRSAVRRLLGMVNFLANHVPNVSSITAPLRDLVKADVHFQWGPDQDKALSQIKSLLSDPPTLQYFDPATQSIIQADASQQGLGAVLMQKGRPIAYASRSLNDTEQNYAQIEKELLAIVFACFKFHHYIYGFHTIIQSDHKPLESIMQKPLHQVSPRLQRMLLKLQKYELTIRYTRGKDMHAADTLSRAFIHVKEESSEETELAVHTLINNLPVSESRKAEFKAATMLDHALQHVQKLTLKGWPIHINNVPQQAREFWKVRDQLSTADGLLFVGERLVIPAAMKDVALQAIHKGHLGIEKCKQRGRSCVYWPAMNEDIEALVKQCETCNKFATSNRKEPMIPHDVPTRPWEKVGIDYFNLLNQDYLLIVDYFSKYPEVILASSKTAGATIKAVQSVFSRHGIPNTVVADNMPFNSAEFKDFAKTWQFTITTTSPNFPQSNGLVERNVQTIKRVIKKAKDSNTSIDLALLEYRNTPISAMNLSPAQLLMSRRLRSSLPMSESLLQPDTCKDVRKQLIGRQQKQQKYYNRGVRLLPPLSRGDVVRYKRAGKWEPTVIINRSETPRSYYIQTLQGSMLRRNRRHLKLTNELLPNLDGDIEDTDEDTNSMVAQSNTQADVNSPQSEAMRHEQGDTRSHAPGKVSRYGRPIIPPTRYRDMTDI